MPLNKRIWQCPGCGIEHDRDINAAINIERKGIHSALNIFEMGINEREPMDREETKDYIHRSMGKYPEFEYYHICLPVSASCGISIEIKDIFTNTMTVICCSKS